MPNWKSLRGKLPDYLLDEDGAVKEWAFMYSGENYNHRHVSHHYDVWPGRAITPEKTPELITPFLLSNRKRSHQDDSAHGVIHRYFTAVRLGDRTDAVHNLRTLMEHGYVTRALFTRHNPYRTTYMPDLCGAMPSMILEMLIFSDEGFIKLLPALSCDMAKGVIKSIWLYTFAKLEKMEWDLSKKKVTAVISSLIDQTVKFSFPLGYKKVSIDNKQIFTSGNAFNLNLVKNKNVTMEFDL
jgi:hypothetical protein